MRKVIFLLPLLLVLLLGLPGARAQSDSVLVMTVEGPVTPAMFSYFERGIQTAERENATAVIVLDTPGGNLDPTLKIVQLFRRATVPVIVYIGPRGAQAASAGSIITIAAHASGMAPETVIGAASPVGDGGAELEDTISRKLIEDLTAQVRSLTEGRSEEARELAVAMISEARAVHAGEALDAGLIDAVAADVPDLLNQLDGRTVTINEREVILQTADVATRAFDMTWIERLLHTLANPLVVSILFALAVPAILIELSSPGGWVAGFVGVLCLALALYGVGQLPVNWLGSGLIVIAFILFIAEVNTPTNGALAVTGALTLVAGLLVLFNSPGTPEFARISIPSAVAVSASTAFFFIFIMSKALRAQKVPARTGAEGMIGQSGPVRSPLVSKTAAAPFRGTVLVMGELWQAEAAEPVEKGERVVVTAVNGFTLRVQKAEPT
jgi:membrane-bound serine protease (ClpP class)